MDIKSYILLTMFFTATQAILEVSLYGYKCGKAIKNVTTSQRDVENCDIEKPQTKKKNERNAAAIVGQL